MKFNLFSDSSEIKFWKYFISKVDNTDNLLHSPNLLKAINDKLNEYFPGLGLGCLTTFVDGKKISLCHSKEAVLVGCLPRNANPRPLAVIVKEIRGKGNFWN